MMQVTTPAGTSVRCKIPPGATPGSTIFLEIPPSTLQTRASGTLAPRQVTVKIPQNVKPGDEMQAVLPDGTKFTFRVPVNAIADSTIRVVLNPDSRVVQDSVDPPSQSESLELSGYGASSQRQDRTCSRNPKPIETGSTHLPPRPSEPAEELCSRFSQLPVTRII